MPGSNQYFKEYDDFAPGHHWVKFNPTGRARIITDPDGSRTYYEHKNKFWFFSFKRWIDRRALVECPEFSDKTLPVSTETSKEESEPQLYFVFFPGKEPNLDLFVWAGSPKEAATTWFSYVTRNEWLSLSDADPAKFLTDLLASGRVCLIDRTPPEPGRPRALDWGPLRSQQQISELLSPGMPDGIKELDQ